MTQVRVPQRKLHGSSPGSSRGLDGTVDVADQLVDGSFQGTSDRSDGEEFRRMPRAGLDLLNGVHRKAAQPGQVLLADPPALAQAAHLRGQGPTPRSLSLARGTACHHMNVPVRSCRIGLLVVFPARSGDGRRRWGVTKLRLLWT